jgi:predicted  nucleic acid-binding Zn-ribbon protein
VFCVECGKEIPDGVKFCPDCGASQIAKVIDETAEEEYRIRKKENAENYRIRKKEIKEEFIRKRKEFLDSVQKASDNMYSSLKKQNLGKIGHSEKTGELDFDDGIQDAEMVDESPDGVKFRHEFETSQVEEVIEETPSTSLKSPGKIGHSEKTGEWEIEVIKYFSRKDAEKLIKGGHKRYPPFPNHFPGWDKAKSGNYYLAVRIKCKRIENLRMSNQAKKLRRELFGKILRPGDDCYDYYRDLEIRILNDLDFSVVGDRKSLYRRVNSKKLGLEPKLALAEFLVGGSFEGWIVFEVLDDDDNFILIFKDSHAASIGWNAEKIYISLS